MSEVKRPSTRAGCCEFCDYILALEAALVKVTKALEKHDAGKGCSRATLGDMAVLVEAFDLIANIPAPHKESR